MNNNTEAENPYATPTHSSEVERERAKLTQMESDRDQYRRISSQYVDEEGLSAAERIELMATTGKDGEAYRSFDYDDLEREFEELNPVK